MPEKQGQNFASVATVRAAIFDVIDAGWLCDDVSGWGEPCRTKHPWHLDPNNESEGQTLFRTRFVDAVIARVAELQHFPAWDIGPER